MPSPAADPVATLVELGVDARPFAGNEVGEYRASEIGVSGLMVTPQARHVDTSGRLVEALLPALKSPDVLLLMLKELPVSDAVMEQLVELPRLRGLNLLGTRVSDAGLSRLDEFPALRDIELPAHASAAALRALARAGRLRGLFAPGNTVLGDGDLGTLRDLPLEILHLPRTRIGDAGLVALRHHAALQLLNLEATPVSDRGLEALRELEALRQLNLRGTRVSATGVEGLRAALPACEISA